MPGKRTSLIVAALLLMPAVPGARAADGPANRVTNGDFTGSVIADGDRRCPVGWQCSEALSVDVAADDDGGKYLRIEAEKRPAGGAYVRQTIPCGDGDGRTIAFEFSCDVRFNDCTPGEKSYMTARVLLLFTTADGILHDRLARKFIGSAAEWRPVYIPCRLPADTREVQVLLGFHTSRGTLCVRRVSLTRVDEPRPQPGRVPGVVMKTLAPGIVETDYGVTRTLKVGDELWYELPDSDPAADWYDMPDPDGVFDRAFLPTCDWTAAEQDQGFVLYQQADTMVARIGHRPRRDQILEAGSPITIRLCPGETRAAAVIVHALRDLPEVSLASGELTSASGHVIAAGNLRADYVEPMYYRANSYRQYAHMPRAIVRFDTMDLAAAAGSQFWIYCAAPASAAPGVYHGQVSMLSAGQRVGAIPLRVEVYPFELAPPAAHWSMYYYYPPDEELPADLKYMRSLGMNSVIYSPPADSMFERLSMVDGVVRFDFEPDDRFMAAYRAAGYRRPVIYYPRLLLLRLVHLTSADRERLPRTLFHAARVPLITSEADYPTAAREAYRQVLGLMVEHARTANWPEMVLYLTDEPFETHWREHETAVSYKIAAEACPQIRTYCTIYEAALMQRFGRYVDFISARGLQRAAGGIQHEEFLAACARTGSRPWASCWPPLWWHNYWYARAYAGFVNVRSGFEGNNVWFFPRVGKGTREPFRSLRPGGSTNGVEVLRRTEAGAYENSTILAGIRDGILDARYIATLEAALQQAREAGRDVSAQTSELEAMVGSAPQLRSDWHGACWDRPGLSDAGDWTVRKNEQMRLRIAEMIVHLRSP